MQSSADGSNRPNRRGKQVSEPLGEHALDQLFRNARTHRAWYPRYIGPEVLSSIYELMKWGPTTNNTSPGRFVFVISREAKERLKPHLNAGNVEQTMSAPV